MSNPPTKGATRSSDGRRGRRWVGLAAVGTVLTLGAVLGVTTLSGDRSVSADDGSVTRVRQGPLTISVLAQGDLSSEQATVIRNQVEGETTILSLIEQGSVVEKGDVLARLDASSLEDEKEQLLIDVEKARAEKISAEQQLEITKQKNEAAKLAAEVELQLARLDFRRYLGASPEEINRSNSKVMERIEKLNNIPTTNNPDYDREMQRLLDAMKGGYKQEIQSALNSIRVSKAEFERAADRLTDSKKLAKKGYITENELQADELEKTRVESELQQARGDLRLLRTFTFQRELANLRNNLKQKQFAQTQAKAQARSNLVEARANLKAKKSKLKQLQSRLKEVKKQIAACTVRAPKDGVVVYVEPEQDWNEMISEGAEVDERQRMFRLPSSKAMVATVDLHQSVVQKVEAGMPARITSSGRAGEFTGKVRKVNRLPETDASQRASNQKVYECEIVVDSKGKLRPGMSVKAEIIVKRFDKATYIPIQAVVQRGGKPTVFTPGPDGPVPQTVKLGLDNNKVVQVKAGLEPGQKVLLTPPLKDNEEDASNDRSASAVARAGSQSGEGDS